MSTEDGAQVARGKPGGVRDIFLLVGATNIEQFATRNYITNLSSNAEH